MEIIPIKTRKINPDDNLVDVLLSALTRAKMQLHEGDIVAIVSKVISLTEGGLVDLTTKKNAKKIVKGRYGMYQDRQSLIDLISKEADTLIDTKMFLSIKNGILTPSAGVDTSNIPDDHAIVWPKNAYTSAAKIRKALGKKKLGVLIFDSFIIPLRNGVTGISLGYSGFRGLESYKGKKDLFGNPLRVTQKNLADGLATAATIVCGEGAESTPFVIIRGAPVTFVEKVSQKEMSRSPKECLYGALYPTCIGAKTC